MPDQADKAAAVSFAVTHGVRLAAEQFRVSQRTIKRWKREARTGKNPGLAEIVKQQDRERIRRRSDLLDQLFEVAARKAMSLVATETNLVRVTTLLEKVGELRLAREALRDGEQEQEHEDKGEDELTDEFTEYAGQGSYTQEIEERQEGQTGSGPTQLN